MVRKISVSKRPAVMALWQRSPALAVGANAEMRLNCPPQALQNTCTYRQSLGVNEVTPRQSIAARTCISFRPLIRSSALKRRAALGSLLRHLRRNTCQQHVQTLSRRGMREDGIPKFCVRQLSQHRCLNCRQRLAGLGAECRESQDAIALCVDQHFQKAACLRNRLHAKHRGHGQLDHAIRNPATLRLRFV